MTTQMDVLQCIKANPGIGREAIASAVGGTVEQAKGCLTCLMRRGCVRSEGCGSATAYYHVKDLPADYKPVKQRRSSIIVDDTPRTVRQIMDASTHEYRYTSVLNALSRKIRKGEVVVDRSRQPYTYRLRREGEEPTPWKRQRGPLMIDGTPRTTRELAELSDWTMRETYNALWRMEKEGLAVCDRTRGPPYAWTARADDNPLVRHMSRCTAKPAYRIAEDAHISTARATVMLRAMERDGTAIADRETDAVALWRLAR